MDPMRLLFLLDRAFTELVEADSEDAWRLKLADLIERLGEEIESSLESAPSHAGGSAPAQEPIIGKLAALIAVGYRPPANRTVEKSKQKLDLMLIKGRDYAEDTLLVVNVPNVTQEELLRLLHERMKWPPCRTRREAAERLVEHLKLSRPTADHRVKKVNEIHKLGLEAGGAFGHAKKGGTSLS